MNVAELQELVTLLRANGVTHYKSAELELHLTDAPVQREEIPRTPEERQAAVESLPALQRAMGKLPAVYRHPNAFRPVE